MISWNEYLRRKLAVLRECVELSTLVVTTLYVATKLVLLIFGVEDKPVTYRFHSLSIPGLLTCMWVILLIWITSGPPKRLRRQPESDDEYDEAL
jgi:hypothetical protein